MKKCPKCGKENIDEARFCTWCRAELPVILEKKKNNPGRIIAIVILIAAICACLVGVFMLFKDKNSGNDQGEAIAQKEENKQVDKDISALSKLDKLKILKLGGNLIEDVEPLMNLKNLTEVSLRDNPIKNVQVLENLTGTDIKLE